MHKTVPRSRRGVAITGFTTRPNISNAVRNVVRRAHDPSVKHLGAVTKISRYVKGTWEMGFT